MNGYKIETIFLSCLDYKVDALLQEWIEENQDIYLEAVELSQQSLSLYNKIFSLKEIVVRGSFLKEVIERFKAEMKYVLKVKYFEDTYRNISKNLKPFKSKYSNAVDNSNQRELIEKDLKKFLEKIVLEKLEENDFKI